MTRPIENVGSQAVCYRFEVVVQESLPPRHRDSPDVRLLHLARHPFRECLPTSLACSTQAPLGQVDQTAPAFSAFAIATGTDEHATLCSSGRVTTRTFSIL